MNTKDFQMFKKEAREYIRLSFNLEVIPNHISRARYLAHKAKVETIYEDWKKNGGLDES